MNLTTVVYRRKKENAPEVLTAAQETFNLYRVGPTPTGGTWQRRYIQVYYLHIEIITHLKTKTSNETGENDSCADVESKHRDTRYITSTLSCKGILT